jgi:hypothetical protein
MGARGLFFVYSNGDRIEHIFWIDHDSSPVGLGAVVVEMLENKNINRWLKNKKQQDTFTVHSEFS